MNKIALGIKWDSTSKVATEAPPEVHHPTAFMECEGDGLEDFPKSGKAVIEFERVASGSSTRAGSTKSNAEIKILSIQPIESDDNDRDDLSEALEKLKKEVEGS